jgi:(4-O-methyl)-D-glucuronate---lignin esterase
VNVTDAVKSGENQLKIDVVNFWPNRIIGDASLPETKRFTRTNIRALTQNTPLMDSGLFGPVRLLAPD